MKVPLLLTLSFLAPTILASAPHATTSAPIFVLKTSRTATSALSRALSKLGYIHQDPRPSNGSYTAPSSINTFVEVSSDTQLLEITELHPKAKFIIPSGGRSFATGRGAESGWFSQSFLSEKSDSGVLELDVLALEGGAQAENWVRLCDFLGMGYSIVERLGLWHFPQ